MKWICTSEKMPEKSGDYFVCILTGTRHPLYDVLEYSKKHNAFCASDLLPTARYAIHVDYWAKIEPVDISRKDNENDQN